MVSLFDTAPQSGALPRRKNVTTYGKLSRITHRQKQSVFGAMQTQSREDPRESSEDVVTQQPKPPLVYVPSSRVKTSGSKASPDHHVPRVSHQTGSETQPIKPGRLNSAKRAHLQSPKAAKDVVHSTSDDSPSKRRRRTPHGEVPQSETLRAPTGIAASDDPGDAAQRSEGASNVTSGRKRSLQKGRSAPTRLMNMVKETNLPEADGESGTDRATTPSTPPGSTMKKGALQRASSLTPKQNKLWSELLEPSPFKDTAALPKRKSTSQQNVVDHPRMDFFSGQNGRSRLADRLKQDSQPTLDDDTDLSISEISSIPDQEPDPRPAALSQRSAYSQSNAKRTYTEETRTYLQETNAADVLLQPLLPEPFDKAANAEHADSDLEDPSQKIRNVHELRAAGNRKRFLDDMNVLVAEIQDHARSARAKRRNALMELTAKLGDPDFSKRFMQSQFAQAVLVECQSRKETDPIADVILLILISRMASKDMSREQVALLAGGPVLDWIYDGMDDRRSTSSLAKDRACNMAKASQASFLEFVNLQMEESFSDMGVPQRVLMSHIAMHAMNLVIKQLRTNGYRQSFTGKASILETLVKAIGRSETPDSDLQIEQQLSLIFLEAESAMTATQTMDENRSWTPPVLRELSKALEDTLRQPEESKTHLALILRILLNVTNNQPRNCEVISDTPATKALLTKVAKTLHGLRDDEGTLDDLLLSLGLSINLAEQSALARRALLSDTPSLRSLCASFVRGQESSSQARSIEQSRTNVALGYLAVLLGNLCLDDEVCQLVRREMPDGSMSSLIAAVEEFLSYHRKVDDGEGNAQEEGGQDWSAFTERLGQVLAKLRA